MKPKFIEVEFIADWPSPALEGAVGQHKKGERAEVRDWIAKALVKRGIARLVEGDQEKNGLEVVERKGNKKV